MVLDQIKRVLQSLGYSTKILFKIDKKLHTKIIHIFKEILWNEPVVIFLIILNTTEDTKSTFECMIRKLVTITIYSTGGHVNGAQKKCI